MSRRPNIPVLLLCLSAAAWADTSSPQPVKFQLLAGAPVVDGVYLDGRGPYRFVLDTGSQRSRISLDLAQELGWKPAFRTRMVTQTNEIMRDGFRVGQVRVGNIESADEEFVSASFEAIHQLDPAIRGFLGQSFLSKLDYLIDFRHKQLKFGAAALPGGVKTPFGLSHGCMVTTTSQGQLTLDSGATTVVLYDPSDVKWKGRLSVHTTEGQARVRFGELKSLRIAGHVFRKVDAAESARQRFDETDTDGLLPASLFASLYISNSGGYVVFNPRQ